MRRLFVAIVSLCIMLPAALAGTLPLLQAGNGAPGGGGGGSSLITVVWLAGTSSITIPANYSNSANTWYVCAGGGGGTFSTGGGGGECRVLTNRTYTPGANRTVSIGAGGAGATVNSTNGIDGGSTSLKADDNSTTAALAIGGNGAQWSLNTAPPGGGTLGGGSGGVGFSGGNGGAGTGNGGSGGGGAAGPSGAGANGGAASAQAGGAGGGGANGGTAGVAASTTAGTDGGDGALGSGHGIGGALGTGGDAQTGTGSGGGGGGSTGGNHGGGIGTTQTLFTDNSGGPNNGVSVGPGGGGGGATGDGAQAQAGSGGNGGMGAGGGGQGNFASGSVVGGNGGNGYIVLVYISGGSSYVGPGDVNSSASAFYGLRAYTAAWILGAGRLINVQRTSDSQTCDIMASASGGLGNTADCSGAANGTAAATFCNATTCQVATVYDQSGANKCSSAPCNATQGTAATRPTLNFSCINSLPCMVGSGSQWLATSWPGGSTIAQPFTFAGVSSRISNTASQGDVFAAAGGGWSFAGAAGFWGAFFGSGVNATITENVIHSEIMAVNGASSAIYIDAVSTSVNPGASAGDGTGWNLFAQGGGTSPLTGNILEAAVWGAAWNSTQAGNMCHNQFGYWGTATSC